MSQFNQIRQVYVDNIIRGEIPILPAYYFYLNHTSNSQVLNQNDFQRLFIRAIKGFIHPISQEINHAILDLDNINNILDNYFDIQYLYNNNQELIKLV